MPHKCKIPKFNQRGEFKTWHFTSELTPTHEIRADIDWIATNNTIIADTPNLHVKACIKANVMDGARPACVTFISWRFSRVNAMSWISNAKAKLPLTALPFEGYIQTNHTIDLPRLLQWMPDAVWEPVGGRLQESAAYQQFSAANDTFEFCNDGSLAVSRGGRPKKVTSVSTSHTISIFRPPVRSLLFGIPNVQRPLESFHNLKPDCRPRAERPPSRCVSYSCTVSFKPR